MEDFERFDELITRYVEDTDTNRVNMAYKEIIATLKNYYNNLSESELRDTIEKYVLNNIIFDYIVRFSAEIERYNDYIMSEEAVKDVFYGLIDAYWDLSLYRKILYYVESIGTSIEETNNDSLDIQSFSDYIEELDDILLNYKVEDSKLNVENYITRLEQSNIYNNLEEVRAIIFIEMSNNILEKVNFFISKYVKVITGAYLDGEMQILATNVSKIIDIETLDKFLDGIKMLLWEVIVYFNSIQYLDDYIDKIYGKEVPNGISQEN